MYEIPKEKLPQHFVHLGGVYSLRMNDEENKLAVYVFRGMAPDTPDPAS